MYFSWMIFSYFFHKRVGFLRLCWGDGWYFLVLLDDFYKRVLVQVYVRNGRPPYLI